MNTAKEFSANNKIHAILYIDLRIRMYDKFNSKSIMKDGVLFKSISNNLQPINVIGSHIRSNLQIENNE